MGKTVGRRGGSAVALSEGTPVAGVTVGAGNASATTDATGLYILQPPGNGQGNQQGVEGTIVPSLPGYSFTPGNRPCDSRHPTHQDFTAVPQGQGSVKAGGEPTGESGQPGAGAPSARHPEARSSGLHAQDPAGQPWASSYGVPLHGGPGPSPFGREETCGDGGGSLTGNGGPDTNAMGSPRAETTATLTNTATFFYVWDQVGSVRVVTDGAGNLVVIHDYEPYGVEIRPNNPTAMPAHALAGSHLYTGQERDADTGLDNFHFRSYASTMGRFLSPDNIPGTPLNPQSFNLYAYVHGNPVNYNDPTGHWMAGLPPGQRYDNGDPFGGLNFAPTGGNLEPESLLDALMDNLPNPAPRASLLPPQATSPSPPFARRGRARSYNHPVVPGRRPDIVTPFNIKSYKRLLSKMSQRSSGRRPVSRAMRATALAPTSWLSWNEKV